MQNRTSVTTSLLVNLVADESLLAMEDTPCLELLEDSIIESIKTGLGLTLGDGGDPFNPRFGLDVISVGNFDGSLRATRPKHISLTLELWIEIV